MQSVMQGLLSVPGVIGGMLADERGAVLSSSFPAFFDQSILKNAAEIMHDNSIGLQDATGGVRLYDIRCELGRVIIKSLSRMYLVVMCQPTCNVQLLFISLNVAIKKLEKIAVESPLPHSLQPAAPQAATTPLVPDDAPRASSSRPAYSDYTAVTDAKGVLLECVIIQKTASTFWDSMSASASINRTTAVEISDFFSTGQFKKLTFTNLNSGESKRVPVTVIQKNRDHSYDGKVLITLALSETLKVREGDRIRSEVVTGGGMYGWEGI